MGYIFDPNVLQSVAKEAIRKQSVEAAQPDSQPHTCLHNFATSCVIRVYSSRLYRSPSPPDFVSTANHLAVTFCLWQPRQDGRDLKVHPSQADRKISRPHQPDASLDLQQRWGGHGYLFVYFVKSASVFVCSVYMIYLCVNV